MCRSLKTDGQGYLLKLEKNLKKLLTNRVSYAKLTSGS